MITPHEATDIASHASPDTLVLRETSTERIHLDGFGARFAGPDGSDKFSVAVELLDGTVFGPLEGVSACPQRGDHVVASAERSLKLLTRLDVDGDHFKNNKYRAKDFFFVERGMLKGRTEVARVLAEELNKLRRSR